MKISSIFVLLSNAMLYSVSVENMKITHSPESSAINEEKDRFAENHSSITSSTGAIKKVLKGQASNTRDALNSSARKDSNKTIPVDNSATLVLVRLKNRADRIDPFCKMAINSEKQAGDSVNSPYASEVGKTNFMCICGRTICVRLGRPSESDPTKRRTVLFCREDAFEKTSDEKSDSQIDNDLLARVSQEEENTKKYINENELRIRMIDSIMFAILGIFVFWYLSRL
ncbi:hypothetical protein ENBRE01_0542 [Enteropsectra breve]|nr:hypothetical protein ENBRE01_0542 [Enteropsectra breve]